MKKIVRSALALSIGLALTACGGDGATYTEIPTYDPTPKTVGVDGGAIKGSLASAAVTVYSADNLSVPISTGTQTSADGSYTLSLTNDNGSRISGALVIEVTADNDSTMVCDAAEMCGTVPRGGIIGPAQLDGMTLTTFTFVDSLVGDSTDVDINSLTTMATDAILASAETNENVDLSTLTQESATSLQVAGTEVVGAILGVDLAGVDLFELDIVDAANAEDVSTTDSNAATLTLINASLASLEAPTDGTYADALTNYLEAVEEVTSAVIADPEVDLETVAPEAVAELAMVQTHVSEETSALQEVVEEEATVTVPVDDVPETVDPEDIVNDIDNIGKPTGGTGAGGS